MCPVFVKNSDINSQKQLAGLIYYFPLYKLGNILKVFLFLMQVYDTCAFSTWLIVLIGEQYRIRTDVLL